MGCATGKERASLPWAVVSFRLPSLPGVVSWLFPSLTLVCSTVTPGTSLLQAFSSSLRIWKQEVEVEATEEGVAPVLLSEVPLTSMLCSQNTLGLFDRVIYRDIIISSSHHTLHLPRLPKAQCVR